MPANLNMATAFVQLALKGAPAVIAGINTLRKGIATQLAPLSNEFAKVEGSLLGFVAAASPQAINTFTGSAKLLSATVGQSLIPYVMKAAAAFQQMADYIKNMNPETKAQIASWVAYGVAVMGAVYVFSKLNDVFGMILKHPVAATFLAISAAILKVNADMEKMIAKMNEAVATMERMKKGVFTESEYKRSAAGAIEAEGGSIEEQLKRAEEVRARLTSEVKAQSGEFYNRDALKTSGDYVKGLFGQTNHLDEQQTSVQQKLKEAGMLDELIGRLKSGGKSATFTSKEDISKGSGGTGFASAGSGMGGQTTSLENAFMQNAQAALAQDELQQKQLQAMLEGNAISQDSKAAMERAAGALERMQLP